MADADSLIAIDCYNAAQTARVPVTVALVRQVIADLLTHQPTCECGHCEAAALARVSDVCIIATSWQRMVAAVPRRAAR